MKPCRGCGGDKTHPRTRKGLWYCLSCESKLRADALAAVVHKPCRISMELSMETVRENFRLSDTGSLLRIYKPSRRRKQGVIAVAGSLNQNGYMKVKFKGKGYQYHRIVFALHNGYWPTAYVDHINGISDDNRPENLREATPSDNARNKRMCGKSGVKGVYKVKRNGKWGAQICAQGRNITLGQFDDIELAELAYLAAADRYFGEFSCAYANSDAP